VIPLRDDIPNGRRPLVTLTLIAVNLIVYLVSLRHGGSLLGGPTSAVAVHYGAIPAEFSHPGIYCDYPGGGVIACHGQAGASVGVGSEAATLLTAISSMFVHAGPLHLLGNMLFLYIFGTNVEDSMGRLRFLAFYILGGLAALALQIVVDPNSLVPTIGASGAITAILGGYILLYPRAKIMTLVFFILFFTVIEIPAILMLGLWFAEQAALGAAGAAGLAATPGNGGGVAYFAHLGGFVFGLLLIKLFITRRESPRPPQPPPPGRPALRV
jgi:membrane associated rhomboid family serine protease